jgi:hypothetical protein
VTISSWPERRKVARTRFTVNRLIVKPRRSKSNWLRSCVALAMITAVASSLLGGLGGPLRIAGLPLAKTGYC